MRRPNEIEREEVAMSTLMGLTGVFEGIASMRIAQIKNQVLQATHFFDELWQIYSQIRVDNQFRFGRGIDVENTIDKELYIIITAEGGFSGDIDQKVVELMLKTYNEAKNDIIVIGHHGVIQLVQHAVSFKKYFKLPTKDQNINVSPIVREVQQYHSTVVFYQQYESLMSQNAKQIELSTAVQEEGKTSSRANEVINEATYIFEPSTFDVVNHLERSMIQIALSQVILESKLAQYASRFKAMTSAHDLATEAKGDLHLQFNRARRAIKDERLKEIINGIRKASSTT